VTLNNIRYNKIIYEVRKFYFDNGITKLPLDPVAIMDSYNWRHMTYEQIAKRNGLSIFDVVKVYGTSDATTIYNGKSYTICYNTNRGPQSRILFSIFHEIGHILLNHFTEFDVTTISKDETKELDSKLYNVLEAEASYFSANVLAPDLVLLSANIDSVEKVMRFCGLSREASENRLNSFNQCPINLKTDFDQCIQNNLQDYIDSRSKIQELPLNILDIDHD
jgi:Zn-dependent peptidase ImmA (M78 family)